MKEKVLTKPKVSGILKKHDNNPAMLIGILQDIQAAANYLPAPNLRHVSDLLEIPLARVYHVATFFRAFSLEPRGDHLVQVCTGTACHVRGAQLILDELERKCGCDAGGTSKDGKFSIETVNCVGACAMGPVIKVDEEYHGQVKAMRLQRILKQYE